MSELGGAVFNPPPESELSGISLSRIVPPATPLRLRCCSGRSAPALGPQANQELIAAAIAHDVLTKQARRPCLSREAWNCPQIHLGFGHSRCPGRSRRRSGYSGPAFHGFHTERALRLASRPFTSTGHHPRCLGRSLQGSEPRPATTATMNGPPARKLSHSSRLPIIHAALGEANKAANPDLPRLPLRTTVQPEVIPLTSACHHPCCLGRSQQGSEPRPATASTANSAAARRRPTSPRLQFIHAALGEANKAANPDQPRLPPWTVLQLGSCSTHLDLPPSTLPWAKPTRQRSRPSTTAIINGRSSSDVIPLIVACHHPPCLGRSQTRQRCRTFLDCHHQRRFGSEVVPLISACHHPRCTCRAFDRFASTSLHPKPTGQCIRTISWEGPHLLHWHIQTVPPPIVRGLLASAQRLAFSCKVPKERSD
jgi:hypothetical protein